ncbi:plasmid replication initiator protein [Streptomyces sp. PT12]|nr:plasmid replication initiator protein [Streptomyces sp. PT12]
MSWVERDVVRVAAEPGFGRWLEQVKGTGGCGQPVYLAGYSMVVDAGSGEVLRYFGTVGEPGGRLAVRCGNRRESRCASCSREHAGDTWHLVAAGLGGGKGVPSSVVSHPRVLVTLTAPGFGVVHRAGRCVRAGAGVCEHGRPVGCGGWHADGAGVVGEPLCRGCYDYAAHVLWHAMLGELWSRTVRGVRRALAAAGGVPRSRLGECLRVSFAKVAEYQKRGAVHVHAVIRLDGPDGPGSPPPAWATGSVLDAAVRAAAGKASVRTPYAPEVGALTCRWGRQLDVHPILDQSAADGALSGEAVAGYVAKYTSKSVGDSGGSDHPVRSWADLVSRRVSGHVRALMAACWRLGAVAELAGLRLRTWCHMLGFRGHVLTKSRRYSTTYTALRGARAAFRSAPAVGGNTVTVSSWRFVGAGHSPGEAEFARGVWLDRMQARALAAEAERGGGGGWWVGRGG